MTTKHKYLTVFLSPALNQQPCCNVLLLRNKNFYHEKVHIKVFERRMRKVYWLSVTFLILVKSGEDRGRQEYDKMRQRNVTYP